MKTKQKMKNRFTIASFAAITGIALSFGNTSNAADLSPFAEGDQAKRARLADLEANSDTPPEINLKGWINHAPTNLAGLKGKIVVLDFWATWCKPCIGAIPKTNALMEKYADKVVIIGICHPNDLGKLAALVKDKGIKYPVALDTDGAAAKAYAIDGYPDYYIIDQTGKLRLADCSNGSVEDAIKALLDAKQETDQKP
jgi:thiol-disulfide isomerase/thioredoxin